MAADLQYAKLKDFIYQYARHRHLYKMPPAARKRFNKFIENKDYDGDQKYWKDVLDNTDAGQFPELYLEGADDTETKKLTRELYEELYSWFQEAFEAMSNNKAKFTNKGKEETTVAFFDKWYGTDNQLFQPKKPVDETKLKSRIKHFYNTILNNPKYSYQLKKIFEARVLPSGMKFEKFVQGVRDEKYLTDDDIRSALMDVAQHVQTYSHITTDEDYWPSELGQLGRYDFSSSTYGTDTGLDTLNPEPDKWFKHTYNPNFPRRLPELFDKLISSKTVRDDFIEFGDSKANHTNAGVLGEKINNAITDTDYANKDSKNYVPPKDDDERNIGERFKKAKDDFKEEHINPWTDMLRGRRVFFSPYARAIVEACSKAKTKDKKTIQPTDGLQAFIDNKEAIKKELADYKKAPGHFDWFIDKLSVYANKYPKAFNGALKNPRKMKKIVSLFIIDGLEESKVAQTKTALEILSIMKYGAFTSKTLDELKKAEFSWLSDKGLSWNKYEGVKFVTSAFDKTLKYSSLGVGRLVAAARNKYFRDHTKFRGKSKFLDAAYDKWKQDNDKDKFDSTLLTDAQRELSTARANQTIQQGLLTRAGGRTGVEGRIITATTNRQMAEQNRETFQNELDQLNEQAADPNIITTLQGELSAKQDEVTQAQGELSTARTTYGTAPTPEQQAEIRTLERKVNSLQAEADAIQTNINHLQPGYLNNLQNDINREQTTINNLDAQIADDQKLLADVDEADNDVEGLQRQVNEMQATSDDWEGKGHKDNYMTLMAYWDRLETYGQSHKNPWLKSMKKVRDDYLNINKLDDEGKDASQADIDTKAWTAWYKNKYSRAA